MPWQFDYQPLECWCLHEFRQTDWEGSYLGYSDIHLSSTDLAKFGLLYRNQGKHDGVQVIPAQWMQDSLESYSEDTDGSCGEQLG